mmetsp:Transcript_45808/g.98835  ORF Transcript_45808/g.98835 Transcript_45808/m.98835 type:complete len:106 (-) Transcript_45808:231-548(-)
MAVEGPVAAAVADPPQHRTPQSAVDVGVPRSCRSLNKEARRDPPSCACYPPGASSPSPRRRSGRLGAIPKLQQNFDEDEVQYSRQGRISRVRRRHGDRAGELTVR